MIPAGEGTCPCGKTGPLFLDPYGGVPSCAACYVPPPRGIVDAPALGDTAATRHAAFAVFAAEWKRVGMPGEPRLESDGSASVAPESWGFRVYYDIASATNVLAGLPAAEEADDEAATAVCEALGVSARIRTEPTACPSCGGNLTSKAPSARTCDSCSATFRRDGDQWTKEPASPRGRRRRKSVAHLLGLTAAGDYRRLYTSLLAGLPRCMGECGRTSRYVSTYSSEFSCGRAGCDRPDGDRWMAAPWKDHVDAAEALLPPKRVQATRAPSKGPARPAARRAR